MPIKTTKKKTVVKYKPKKGTMTPKKTKAITKTKKTTKTNKDKLKDLLKKNNGVIKIKYKGNKIKHPTEKKLNGIAKWLC